jgi:hypothetical protein
MNSYDDKFSMIYSGKWKTWFKGEILLFKRIQVTQDVDNPLERTGKFPQCSYDYLIAFPGTLK